MTLDIIIPHISKNSDLSGTYDRSEYVRYNIYLVNKKNDHMPWRRHMTADLVTILSAARRLYSIRAIDSLQEGIFIMTSCDFMAAEERPEDHECLSTI